MKHMWKSMQTILLLMVMMMGCSMTVCAAEAVHVQFGNLPDGWSTSSDGTTTRGDGTEYVLEGDWRREGNFKINVAGSDKVSIASGAAIDVLESGTIEENHGTIISVRGTVVTNNGTIERNRGTVTNNKGSIEENYETVTTNNGTIQNNYETVTTNNGTIEKNDETVTTNNGTIEKKLWYCCNE